MEHVQEDDFAKELEKEIVAQDPHLESLHIETMEAETEILHYVPYMFEMPARKYYFDFIF